MRNWIKRNQWKIIGKSMLIVIAIFMIVMIPVVIDSMDTGDYEVAVATLFLSFIVTLFIFLITLGLNTLKANRLIRAQEAIGIDFEYEVFEEETLGTCGFSGDWFLYHKNEALAFHRNYIERVEEGKVKDGKYYTTGIHLYTVDGKKYGLVVKKTYIDEVILRLNAWCGGRPEYMFGEGEVTSNELCLERQVEGVDRKVDWKRIGLIVVGVISALVATLLVVVILGQEDVVENTRVEEVIADINDASMYVGVEEYSQYLNVVEDADAPVELYIDYAEDENSYYMEFQNLSEYFINGSLVLEDEDGNEIDRFELEMIRPFGSVLGTVTLNEYPSVYRLEDTTYFDFEYNELFFDVSFVDDYNDEYVWTNIIIDGEEYSIENVEESLKRLYGECVISNLSDNLVYIYNTYRAQTYEYNEIKYYDLSTADFMAYILLEDRLIELYSIEEDGSVELIDTIGME